MKNLFLLLFIAACSSKTAVNVKNYQSINFDKNFSFNEFNMLLDKYNETADFPEIDK